MGKAIGYGRTRAFGREREKCAQVSFDSIELFITVFCVLVFDPKECILYIYLYTCGCEMKRCYAVDASYSFKDLVLSTPSWTLSSRKEEEEEEEDCIIDAKSKKTFLDDDFDAEKKTFKKRNETQSFFARKRKTRGDHAEEEEEEEEEELLSSKMDVRPKKSKTSLADALFAKGSLADAAAKSRAWGPGETAETRRSALSEWHKTVDKFRDDYKAKRKAAVKRCKRVGVARGGGGFGKTIE